MAKALPTCMFLLARLRPIISDVLKGVVDRLLLGSPKPLLSVGRHSYLDLKPNSCLSLQARIRKRGSLFLEVFIMANTTSNTLTCFVGIDVSKATLDIAIRPTNEQFQITNDEKEFPALVARLKGLPVERI